MPSNSGSTPLSWLLGVLILFGLSSPLHAQAPSPPAAPKAWPFLPEDKLIRVGPNYPEIDYQGQISKLHVDKWPEKDPDISQGHLWRTAMLVRSIDEAMKLYVDVLGMRKIYEKRYLSDYPLVIDFLGLEPNRRYMMQILGNNTGGEVVMNAGFIGLIEPEPGFKAIPMNKSAEGERRFGDPILYFLVKDGVATFNKLKAGGYKMMNDKPEGLRPGNPIQIFAYGPNGERLWISERKNIQAFISKSYFGGQ